MNSTICRAVLLVAVHLLLPLGDQEVLVFALNIYAGHPGLQGFKEFESPGTTLYGAQQDNVLYQTNISQFISTCSGRKTLLNAQANSVDFKRRE